MLCALLGVTSKNVYRDDHCGNILAALKFIITNPDYQTFTLPSYFILIETHI